MITTVPPAASIFWRAEAEKRCACTVSATPISPSPRILTGCLSVRRTRAASSASGVTSAPASKRAASGRDVHAVRVRAEGADRHGVLGVRAAQLRDLHVQRHLAADEPGPHHVRARAGLLALLTAARRLARAAALTAPDPLALLGGARCRREVVETDALLLVHQASFFLSATAPSSTFTRNATLCSMPRSVGESSCTAVEPMRPRPSARSVPRCSLLVADLGANLGDADGHQASPSGSAAGATATSAGAAATAASDLARARAAAPRRPSCRAAWRRPRGAAAP